MADIFFAEGSMLVSKQTPTLSAFYSVEKIDLNGYLLIHLAWASAHLKRLIQREIEDAATGRRAVPGEVPGAGVARIGDFHTSVINLQKWSQGFGK